MNSYANEVNIVDKDFPIAPTHQVDNYELLTNSYCPYFLT